MSEIAPVEIVGPLELEAIVRRVRYFSAKTVIELVLADGSRAAAHLSRDEADWLEVRAGDIVGVRRLSE